MLGIQSAGDVRVASYVALPVIATALATVSTVSDQHAAGWAALAAAIGGPLLAFIKTPSGKRGRAALYAIVAAAQLLVTGYGLLDGDLGVWLPVITATLGALAGAPAAANTVTTDPAAARTGTLDDLVQQQVKAAAEHAAKTAMQSAAAAIRAGTGLHSAQETAQETAQEFLQRMGWHR